MFQKLKKAASFSRIPIYQVEIYLMGVFLFFLFSRSMARDYFRKDGNGAESWAGKLYPACAQGRVDNVDNFVENAGSA